MAVDMDRLQAWIGRHESATDQVTAAPLAGLTAALDRDEPVPGSGAAVPPGGHWLFFHTRVRQSELNEAGHPQTGDFLPPPPLPRRLWAGGRLTHHRPLAVGETIERTATIRDITMKDGRNGALVFVLVHHAIKGTDGLAVEEEHDIVYREAAKPGQAPPPPKLAPTDAAWSQTVTPDPMLLFRFSALTFNAARIHYDRRYVTEVEGYPGLIVNARLVAIMLMDLCREPFAGRAMTGFDYRFLRPMFDNAPFTLGGKPGADGASAELWAADADGNLSMTATARFDATARA